MTHATLASLARLQRLVTARPGLAVAVTHQTAAARGAQAGLAVALGLAVIFVVKLACSAGRPLFYTRLTARRVYIRLRSHLDRLLGAILVLLAIRSAAP